MATRISTILLAASAVAALGGAAVAQQGPSGTTFVDQGADWTQLRRVQFYTQDQGSQLMPLAWLRALKTADGQPFLADNLARYGYLPNPVSAAGLPVGFTGATVGKREMAGMTCAACHTREIEVGGSSYRIDGGPAIVDFQRLLVDLDAALGRVVDDSAVFRNFASDVLGGDASKPAAVAALKKEVSLWHQREHALVTHALPSAGMWGLGRLDAVSMIFNRLAGLDIGTAPSYVIADNISPADAPVRYPFVWNAARQDFTQWPGFSPNGNALLGLARNSGEVYGVFATFHPRKDLLGLADFHSDNSANFRGLNAVEDLLWKIGPPKWPFAVKPELLPRGQQVYEQQCASCHAPRDGETRSLLYKTWATPKQDVGTDSHQYDILVREVSTGWLAGQRLPVPIISPRLASRAKAIDLLRVSVIGSMLQHPFDLPLFNTAGVASSSPGKEKAARQALRVADAQWKGRTDASLGGRATSFPYESRVLYGIWATAPYLHNGSVPTLADLLKKPEQRPAAFDVGRSYDIDKVGLAANQNGRGERRVTTGCEARNSGNSRCGHDFGTDLSEPDKLALLEYLKVLRPPQEP
jgi:mono/diheme cytochrome c family protein